MSATTKAPNPEIKNKDLLAVRGWVTARDATQYDAVHQSTVILDLTHSNLQQRHIEIRFDKHDTLERLRNRIHQKTGTAPHFQQLQIKSANTIMNEIPPETPDHYKLGYFGLEYHGLEVHCVDLNPNSGSVGGQYEDVSLVQKYKMSEEEYNQRKGTLRDWGREQKSKDSTFTMAKHAKQHRELVDAQRANRLNLPMPEGFFVDNNGTVVRDDDEDNAQPSTTSTATATATATTTTSKQIEEVDDLHEEDSVADMEVGMRCQIEPGSRRGVVSFVGLVPELGTGHWVGVTFDEPVGKTDGTAKGGKQYFEAPDRHGGFVRGKNMQVGDFPERDIFEDDSDEDEL
jgi:tubulin-folding cofactor B